MPTGYRGGEGRDAADPTIDTLLTKAASLKPVDQRLLRRWEITARAVIVRDPSGGSIRPIHAGFRRHHVGFISSNKMGRAIDWESPVERTVISYCEVDPGVVAYMSQPHRLEIRTAGSTLVYIPDVERRLADGSREVLEAKSRRDLRWLGDPDYRAKIDLAAEIYQSLGWRFAVVEESEIDARSDLRQVKRMFSSRFAEVPKIQLLDLMSALRQDPDGIPLGSALSLFGSGPRAERILDFLTIRRIATRTPFSGGESSRVRAVRADEPAIRLGCAP